MGQKAFLVIDMLNDFVREDGALYVGEKGRQIIPFIAAKLKEARQQGWPVVYICDRHRTDDKEFTMFPPHCIEGSDGASVCEELAPHQGELVIPKRRFSGFYGTDLDLSLRELGVEELILVGVCTNICVFFTAADARMRNYQVTVLKDGVASFDESAHNFALQQMEKVLGVKII